MRTYWLLDCVDSPNPNGSGITYETFEEARDNAIKSLEAGIERLKAADPASIGPWPAEVNEFITLQPVEMTFEDYEALEEMG